MPGLRILMVALPYHHYTSSIAAEMRHMGHDVVLHDIQPRDTVTKALRKLSPRQWQVRINQHHQRILMSERGKRFDQVIFIQVHQMEPSTFSRFRESFPDSRFVLYNWDSISNHDYRPYIGGFNQVLTFDPDDARDLGVGYLPLFCLRDFQGLARRCQDRGQVYFVGNLGKLPRYEAFRAFKRYCAGEGVPLRSHLAVTPPVWLQLVRAGGNPKDVALGSIDRSSFIDMMETSVATFDFANHAQSGYTMRVIENLCAGKKIITANPRVKQESFYSPDRFFVFESLDFEGVADFVRTPLCYPEADFPDYHIQSFVGHLLEGQGHALPKRLAA